MFRNCISFNSNVKMFDGITNAQYMFYDCQGFNANVIFPNTLKNADHMLSNCYMLNRPIKFPDSCTTLTYALANCYEFNQDFDKVVRQQVVTRHETDSATGREGKGRLSRDSAARQRPVTPAHQGHPAEGAAVS